MYIYRILGKCKNIARSVYTIFIFVVRTNKFKPFIKYFMDQPISTERLNKKVDVTIYIPPWRYTYIYKLFLTIASLYKYMGHNVLILWDDVVNYDPYDMKFERRAINGIMDFITPYISITKLSSYKDDYDIGISQEDLEAINYLAQLRFIRWVGTSFPGNGKNKVLSNIKESLIKSYPLIKKFLKSTKSDVMLVPGGVAGNTGLIYYLAGKLCNLRVVSYDSVGIGPTKIVWGTDDVAVHSMPVPKLVNKMKEQKDFDKALYISLAKQELQSRIDRIDEGKFQILPYNSTEKIGKTFDVVFLLNVEYDSACLGLDKIFRSYYEWLTETIGYLLEKTDFTIAVRQHPAERRLGANKFILKREFAKRFNDPRITFFSCDENINTYKLIENAKVICPWSSTIGVEAAILGKAVIVHTNCYYAQSSFVFTANSKTNYYDLIITAVRKGWHNVNIDEAYLYYYVSKILYVIETRLTTANFIGYTKKGYIENKNIKELLDDDQIRYVLDLILNGY